MTSQLEKFRNTSYLNGANAAYVEDLYDQYLRDPDALASEWRSYFDDLSEGASDVSHQQVKDAFVQLGKAKKYVVTSTGVGLSPEAAEKQAAVLRLINAYRVRGHQIASLDPLGLQDIPVIPDLDPDFHGLTQEDMSKTFNTGSLATSDRATLGEVISTLKEVYCRTIGTEYMHITDTDQKRWIQDRLERSLAKPDFSVETRKRILERVTAAEGIERYLHSKYVGQKRFSLEGSESLIALLDDVVQRAGAQGVKEIVLGMAHRGRLNVLVNVMGKSPGDLFQEFEDKFDIPLSHNGDVKYHLGYSSDVQTEGGPVHLALSFNPSHLEIIDPVVEGSARARQQRREDIGGDQVLPILIHGDAAFAGQGVIMENFQLSEARGFTTGGTVHVIVNNQIGFTTSNPLDARSTVYCTEVAKMVEAPIWHVNGDDPDAVVFVTQLALDFRQTFKKDVIIDVVCYRRWGHNEADEPAATQPMMYQRIKELPTTRQLYSQKLVDQGVIGEQEPEEFVEEYRNALDERRRVSYGVLDGMHNEFGVDWSKYHSDDWTMAIDTTVSVPRIQEVYEKLTLLPEGFELHPSVRRLMDNRKKMAAGALVMDWGFAETLAYATLLADGKKIRLTGQDSGRGTFAHRHAVLHNAIDGSTYIPLKSLTKGIYDFVIIDSLLSEEAVLAFEYGFSTADPETLVIWEAQFGDFANGAQVVIDQFISSGETKWGRLCGLSLFLPHGYEGAGPEHSSARLERFLQLCAEHNIQVCVPTTPAQAFHMIRRQHLRPYRKPLIVMTPKSLLRHKLATSSLEDLSNGEFQVVIDEIDDVKAKDVTRIVLCSGKVYYDLLEERRRREMTDTAILRVEQLYPFPEEHLGKLLRQRYSKATDIVWCQEEPRNQGAWYCSKHHFEACMKANQTLRFAGRPASASPAAGSKSVDAEQQKALVNEALS